MEDNRSFDVLIIGAGVSGSAIARELSKTTLRTGVLEQEPDVCEGTSKANSGIVHAGYDAVPGTLKARLNIAGAKIMPQLAEDLGFDYIQNGSLVLCFEEEGRSRIRELLERGEKNGVRNLRILERDEILQLEPHVSPEVVCALYAPTAGIVCPFGLNVALAENAADNGVEFFFDTPVRSLEKTETGWRVNGLYEAKIVVNAAGVHADDIHNMTGAEPFGLRTRRGEYFLLDKSAGDLCTATLFQLPSGKGKGVLVAPTVHGNLIAGPTAEFTDGKEETSTTAEGLATVRSHALRSMPSLPFGQVITSFAGLRAVPEDGDFIIRESLPGFIDVAGIESPGLTSAPAIGEFVAKKIRKMLKAEPDPGFKTHRRGFVNVRSLPAEEWNRLIEEDPEYGHMVCRCESVTAGQIRDACRRSVPARTLDGIKRRVRAGMGRCQAGFCSPKVMEILSEETGVPMEKILKSGAGSQVIAGKDKEVGLYEK